MDNKAYKFGDFTLYTETRQLLRGTEIIKLSSYAYDILLFLIERRSVGLVGKDELLQKIWEGVFIEENNLAVHVSALRRILGEKRGDNKFIETLAGRGYRFVASVEEIQLEQRSESERSINTGGNFFNKTHYLAVLPLTTKGDESSLKYLSEGITEEIINNLSKLPQLKVFARSAVFQYKDQNPNLKDIGFLLGADTILNGNLSLIDERLEISVELVNVFDQSCIWGKQFKCRFDDIFKVKTEISHAVAEGLEIKLKESDALKISRRSTVSSDAYSLYLKGRYLLAKRSTLAKRTKEGMLKGIEFYRRAIKKDPTYALAYTGMADAYFALCIYNHSTSLETIPKAKKAVERALTLDDMLSEAHASNGLIQHRFEWKWKEAQKSLKLAISLNPNNSLAYSYYSSFLSFYGRPLEEVLHYRYKALELDPFSPLYNIGLITHFNFAGEYGKAITVGEDILEIDPNHAMILSHLALAHAKLGFYDEAFDYINRALKLLPAMSEIILHKGWIHASAGDSKAARELLVKLMSRSTREVTDYYDVATVYAALGRTDEALNCIEKAVESHSMSICALKVDPRFEILHSVPKFTTLLKRIGLE